MEENGQNENRLLRERRKHRRNIQKEITGKTVEWIVLGVLFSLIGVSIYFFYSRSGPIFWIFAAVEFILFLILNKRLNGHYEENSESKGDLSTRRKLKKWTFKFLILQLYLIIIGFCIVNIGVIIAIIIYSGGIGLGGIALLIWLIRAKRRKK